MRRLIISLNLLAPLALLGLAISGHFWVGLAILFAAHMLLLAATLLPNSTWLGPVITRFNTDKDEIWLTIDDGPDPRDTPILLDLLDAAGAKATFFLIGQKAKAHPALVHDIVRRGHGIGNHTFSHPAYAFWRLGPASLRSEIDGGVDALAALGHPTSLFRAPAGMKNPFVHPILKKMGHTLIGWTTRGFDGTDTDPERILSRLTKNLRPGSILLIHESQPQPESQPVAELAQSSTATQAGDRLAPVVLHRLLATAARKSLRFILPPAGSLR